MGGDVHRRGQCRAQGQDRRPELQQQRAHTPYKTATGVFRNCTRSNDPPRISFASAPRWPPRISWYTERKSTAYLRLPIVSRLVRLGSAPYRPLLTGSPISSNGAAAPWSVPPLAFSFGRRPNSDHVAIRTLSAFPCAARSA